MRLFVVAVLLALAATPGAAAPAWWRVSSGRSEVWILGVPAVAPRGMAWDQQVLRQRLRGASQLIVAPQARGGLRALGGLIGAAGALHSPQPMEEGLQPQLRRRFAAARARIGKDAGHYSSWKPAVAGTLLQSDFLKASDLKVGEIESTIRKAARAAGVRETVAGTYDTGPMISAAGVLGPAGQAACLTSELHGIEPGPGPLRAAADAWARGEIKPAPINPVDQACLNAFPAMNSLVSRTMDAESAAVALALSHPGRSVAVVELATLTRPGGLLDRLRGRRLAVSGPQP